jgi:repressor LexA
MHPTRRQKEILEALRSFLREHGRPPTLLELARRCGLSAPSAVHKHLTLLEERGLVRRRRGRRRGIEVLPGAARAPGVEAPLLGTIAAGRPIEAVTEERSIGLPRDLARGRRTYVLRVRGDSMIDEQIRDGDYVVVEERAAARDGEVVVALIDGREATLKVLRRERGRVRLQPANPALKPLRLRPGAVRVQGVVTGLLRKYD